MPRFGVYAAKACFDGRALPAVVNIGTRPTVGGSGVTTYAENIGVMAVTRMSLPSGLSARSFSSARSIFAL